MNSKVSAFLLVSSIFCVTSNGEILRRNRPGSPAPIRRSVAPRPNSTAAPVALPGRVAYDGTAALPPGDYSALFAPPKTQGNPVAPNHVGGGAGQASVSSAVIAKPSNVRPTTDSAYESDSYQSLTSEFNPLAKVDAISENDTDMGGWCFSESAPNKPIAAIGHMVREYSASRNWGFAISLDGNQSEKNYWRRTIVSGTSPSVTPSPLVISEMTRVKAQREWLKKTGAVALLQGGIQGSTYRFPAAPDSGMTLSRTYSREGHPDILAQWKTGRPGQDMICRFDGEGTRRLAKRVYNNVNPRTLTLEEMKQTFAAGKSPNLAELTRNWNMGFACTKLDTGVSVSAGMAHLFKQLDPQGMPIIATGFEDQVTSNHDYRISLEIAGNIHSKMTSGGYVPDDEQRYFRYVSALVEESRTKQLRQPPEIWHLDGQASAQGNLVFRRKGVQTLTPRWVTNPDNRRKELMYLVSDGAGHEWLCL